MIIDFFPAVRLRLALPLLVIFLLATAVIAQAQSAYFGGSITTIGSGFSSPFGVAVDGNGNVFVADIYNNAVKEIVAGTGGAAIGTVNGSSTVNTIGSGFSCWPNRWKSFSRLPVSFLPRLSRLSRRT